jgi:uncharacterized protein YndB with AHSA1/START domain
MSRVKSEVTIARPAEAVYAFLLDLDEHASDPDTASVDREPAGPTVAGTTFRFHHAKGRETSMVYTALDPNRRIDFEGDVGPLRPRGAFVLEGGGSTTTLRVDVDAQPQGALRLASPVVSLIGKRIWDKRLARIKASLEGSAAAPD